ncbi:hypothetical protein [Pedobacter duraquae]|uniref:Uncharacterized protein n=1 Tax=Pedobacter duraquae TaxID=425511 RepID=A0A4R6IPQ8_9SPHI|nr:hypothetical protein [Pedobacter duraquae]TDO24282.1 hypothetical protein CLV32_0571 [Pedobacter duraquae]
MSIKSITKTKWSIEPGRVIVYPNGLSFILAGVLSLIFAGIFFLFLYYENMGMSLSWGIIIVFIAPLVLLWLHGYTQIIFDNANQTMKKMLFGIFPVKTIPFSRIHTINAVSNMGGGYNYRVFTKENKFGRGTTVSCGYSKTDDPNAIAFVEEAVPAIYAFLDQSYNPAADAPEFIDSYKYFTAENGIYTLKNKRLGAIIFGLFFIALGVWMAMVDAMGNETSPGAKFFITVILIIVGLVFINAAFTKVEINTIDQTLKRTGLIKLGNKFYALQDFNGFQTVRKSVNFIYTGTEVHMYFSPSGTFKQEVIVLQTLRNSNQIERFLQEMYQIMDEISVQTKNRP